MPDTDTGIIYYPRGERVTARIAPAPAPWEVLTASHARDYANYFTGMLELETADHFIAYADAVDAHRVRDCNGIADKSRPYPDGAPCGTTGSEPTPRAQGDG